MRRVGIIGFGSIAENAHLPAWQAFPGVEVVGVADLSPERLECARRCLPDAQLYSSSAELIARAGVDTLDICSPPSSHAELIVAACDRGVGDIVSEKPFVLSEAEFVDVARARARSGSRIVSVNNWMHSDLHRLVRSVLAGGALGAVRQVTLRTGRPDSARGNPGWMPQWRINPALAGGGIILDHGWHQIYLMLGWFMRPVLEVSATTRVANPKHFPVEDEATLELRFSDGEGRIELSWTADERSNGGHIAGDLGEITVYDDRIVVHNGTNEVERPFQGRLTESSYHPDWFEAMFRTTVFNVESSEADRNFAEAGTLVSIIAAAYRSARDGGRPQRPVFPDEVLVRA